MKKNRIEETLYYCNFNVAEVSRELKIKYGSLYMYAKRNGLLIPPAKRHTDKDKIQNLFKVGKSITEIAYILNLSNSKVSKIVKAGMKEKRYNYVKKLKRIKTKYNMSNINIATNLKVSKRTVSSWLSEQSKPNITNRYRIMQFNELSNNPLDKF